MKIALYIPSLEGGGAERVIINLAGEFVYRGFSVDLVLVQKKGSYINEVHSKVNIVDLKAKRVSSSLFPLVRYIQREKPDVVLSTLNHANLIAILANKIAGVHSHCVIRVPSYFSLTEKWHIKSLAKVLYPKSNRIIAVSHGVKQDLAKTLHIPKDKICVLYNPIHNKSITEMARKDVDHLFFKNKKDKIILGVGNLIKDKDFGTLLKAFFELNKKLENIKLIILGEGEERKSLERLIEELNIKESVSLPGFINNPYAYMARADALVLSSLSEGFPNVIVEAMACGTSIVSVDCPGGVSEILQQGKYGMLTRQGNVMALADAMNEILENPFDPDMLKKRANEFDIEEIASKYLEAFHEQKTYQ